MSLSLKKGTLWVQAHSTMSVDETWESILLAHLLGWSYYWKVWGLVIRAVDRACQAPSSLFKGIVYAMKPQKGFVDFFDCRSWGVEKREQNKAKLTNVTRQFPGWVQDGFGLALQ